MQCTVCKKDTDVLAEGKCMGCYEKTAEIAMPQLQEGYSVTPAPEAPKQPAHPASGIAPEPAVPVVPVTPVAPQQTVAPQPAVPQSPVSVTPHAAVAARAVQAEPSVVPAQLPAHTSAMKRVVQIASLCIVALIAAAGITYYMLYVSAGDMESTLGQARLTTATTEEDFDQPGSDVEQTGEEPDNSDTEEDVGIEEGDEDAENRDEENDIDTGGESDTEQEDAVSEKNETKKYTDTDGDGMPDYIEARFGTDPDSADTDGDLLTDADEIHGGTDPLSADTDGDSVPDNEDIDPNDSSVA